MSYELVLMIKPNLTEDIAKKAVDEVKDFVKSLDGKIEKEDFWGKRKLAYEIKRMQEAYYAVLNISLDKAKYTKLPTKLNLSDSVFRYLITTEEK